MTLRRRLVAATAVSAVAIVILAIVVAMQYWLASASQRALFDGLAPAADDSASLILAQTDASSAVADHLILGSDESLAAYGAAIAQADQLMARLDKVITDDMPQLSSLQAAAARTQQAWVAADARPALSMIANDQRVKAAKHYASDEARAAYAAMIAASHALSDGVNDVRGAAAGAVTGFTSLLGITLLVVGLLVAAGLAALLVAIRQWVLVPLTLVRRDLRKAARSPAHEEPIDPQGPPEIQAVANDAEQLRRQLVMEIDEARAAREGLMQDAPLVASMREEMRGPDTHVTDFAVIAGSSEAAEGIMSGDWWDIVDRPNGSIAIVIADASGHGPEASVAAVRVRSVLRSALDAGLPLNQAAEMGARSCGRDEHFVTCLIIELGPTGVLRWTNAGHHPALAITPDKESSTLDPTGPLLSVLGGEWQVRERAIVPGEFVIAYTDGLVESRAADGTELGLAEVELYLRGLDGHIRSQPEEAMRRVVAHARAKSADWRRDDVTVVAIAYRPD